MNRPIILDLCGGTGAWSHPYREAGYDVKIITLPSDVRLLAHPGPVHGILAAPPCTVFAVSGNRWPRTQDDYKNALSVVDACLRFVVTCKPKWWALENPVGTLHRYIGKPKMTFQPCDYGDPYTKKTLLWGNFTAPKKCPVPATQGSIITTKLGGKQKQKRSTTPQGFATAFFEANP